MSSGRAFFTGTVQQRGSRYNLPVLRSTKSIGLSLSVTAGFNNELGTKLTTSVIDMMMRAAMKGRGGRGAGL